MPQWRKLHVKATESLDINDMPNDFMRLLWVMIPLALDREGRGLDNPSWLKSKIMPLRTDVSLEMIEEAMDWYERRGMIERYEVDGRKYFWVPSFPKYQGNTNREAESDYPAPEQIEDNSRVSHELVVSNSGVDQEQVVSNSCLEEEVDSDSDTDRDSDTDTDTNAAEEQKRVVSRQIFEYFESNITLLTPALADKVGDWIDHFPRDWITEAIDIAVANSKRRASYVQGILDNWQVEGKNSGKRNGRQKFKDPDDPEHRRKYAESIKKYQDE